MAGKWRTLSLETENLPQLLLKATLDVSGYTIHLTDLSRIWGESLTKKQLFRRALDDACRIDPTEGDDQVRILIEKVGNAIQQREGTSLVIQSAEQDDLVLKLTAPLPHPLPELQWDIYLNLLPAHSVRAELALPLLHHAQNLQIMMQNLIHEIQDKDRIIAKVTDRLEQSGQDLTDVFPGVSNVKLSRKRSLQTQREQLAKHVKGLGDFDEQSWKARHAPIDGHGAIKADALNSLLCEMPPASEASPDVADEWWRRLNDSDSATARSRAPMSTHRNHEGQCIGTVLEQGQNEDVEVEGTNVDGDADDMEFQRQGTPPELQNGNEERAQRIESSFPNEQQAVVVDDESTDDEDDDLDAPASRKPVVSKESTSPVPRRRRNASPNASHTMPRKIGRTLGTKDKLASPNPEPTSLAKDASPAPALQKVRSKLGKIGGKATASSTPEPKPAAPVPASATKSKLGRIGGRKQALSSNESAPASSATEGAVPSPSPSKLSKLGRIGGKKARLSSPARTEHEPVAAASEENGRKSRASEREAKESTPPSETSQERADRRREELKRQLEDKAKAPTKKKRKF
ncbi:XLF-Cernunnos, XRcc4-like factor, NHEJ component [Teratosphaeria destructans]|uniref:Non-homologous end-joining factor 1 n=1 Tax=Teratosphaeria destructans TaxID=418781 RepID=A0A9W7W4X1_9PEZI|nr:XLF-Cernunnos, XRcc4-like factor, NHEJ component [Teratosphaeria destructans]